MSLNESIVEDAALEWFRRRQGYAGLVGDPPMPPPSPRLWRSGRLRRTGLGYAVGHGAAFAGRQRAKPSLSPDEPAAESACALHADRRDGFGEVVQSRVARTLTPALFQKERENREAIRRLDPATRSATFHLTKGIACELLGKAAYRKTRGLNPIRYAEMVREYLHDHPSISNREVRELLGLRESPRARIRIMVKRILNKYGYPPDLQEEAVKTVLRQAELLCGDWGEVPQTG